MRTHQNTSKVFVLHSLRFRWSLLDVHIALSIFVYYEYPPIRNNMTNELLVVSALPLLVFKEDSLIQVSGSSLNQLLNLFDIKTQTVHILDMRDSRLVSME